jgi:hypothetical protein
VSSSASIVPSSRDSSAVICARPFYKQDGQFSGNVTVRSTSSFGVQTQRLFQLIPTSHIKDHDHRDHHLFPEVVGVLVERVLHGPALALPALAVRPHRRNGP